MDAELLQRLAALLAVAGAALYLARHAWRAVRRRGAPSPGAPGCGGDCGCSSGG